jgi:hypothetical protein
MSVSYLAAWLLPWLTGATVYLAVSPQRVAGWWASAAGYGFLGGMLLVALYTAGVGHAYTAHAWGYAACCLMATFAAALAAVLRRWRSSRVAVAQVSARPARAMVFFVATLIASLALRGGIAARETWLRPLYPWDAWAAWAVKAKTWVLLGHYVPFVSMAEWLRASQENLYTNVAWFYPNALAWVDVWFACAAGGWIEPLVNLPWVGLWVALLIAHYGQWRALGLDRTRAAIFVYVLGSLPLLSVHAAIAGYADMWVAAAFGLGVLSWMRWLQRGERSQLALALACALVLPWLKMEGWIWAACLLAAIGYGTLPVRLRWWMSIGAAILFLILFPFGGLRFLCLQAGVINADGSIAMPAIGPLSLVLNLHWRPGALEGAAETMLAQPNWHLLWWLTPALVVWRWRALVAHGWLRLPALLLFVCAALLLILFLFTGASAWAQSFTAINRLILQLVPAWVSVLALLLRDVGRPVAASDTVPARDPHSDPA